MNIRSKKLQTRKRSSIRRSTDQDLAFIHAWLMEEDAQGVHGNFLCNWRVIEDSHTNKELLVYIDGTIGQPVGYQLGGLMDPGILQVHDSFRGKGIGRKLVERCITLANKNNEPCLYIQCKPSSSIPFWQNMGFTIIECNNFNGYAYRVIEKDLEIPIEGTDVGVSIAFYPESKKWTPQEKPYLNLTPAARIGPNGMIYLAHRIIFHERAFPKSNDAVVEVEICGSTFYLDKARYQEAQDLGVIRCQNGYYIDRLKGPFPDGGKV